MEGCKYTPSATKQIRFQHVFMLQIAHMILQLMNLFDFST